MEVEETEIDEKNCKHQWLLLDTWAGEEGNMSAVAWCPNCGEVRSKGR